MFRTIADVGNAKAVVAAVEAAAKERPLWRPGATERNYWQIFLWKYIDDLLYKPKENNTEGDKK
jgi:hypothetical protein